MHLSSQAKKLKKDHHCRRQNLAFLDYCIKMMAPFPGTITRSSSFFLRETTQYGAECLPSRKEFRLRSRRTGQ